MKKSTKILTAASLAAGGALGVLFAPDKGTETRKKLDKQLKKLKGLMSSESKRERLMLIREKLEEHKQKVDMHLQKINEKLAAYEAKTESKENWT